MASKQIHEKDDIFKNQIKVSYTLNYRLGRIVIPAALLDIMSLTNTILTYVKVTELIIKIEIHFFFS